MKHLTIGLMCLVLAGCADQSVAPSKLEGPSARLMRAPEPLPIVKVGDDLNVKHAALRALYSKETRRLMSLQQYVRTIIKK